MNQARTSRSFWIGIFALSLFVTVPLAAAQIARENKRPKIDFALTFASDRTNAVNYTHRWLNGGSVEMGVEAWRGLGIAAKVTGLTTASIDDQNVPLNLVVTAFGPRYRLSRPTRSGHQISIYGEGLIGEANGFKSTFATPIGVTNTSNAFALQVGGGFDYIWKPRFGLRLVDANWMGTQFPNGTTNVQNHLQLGTGIFLRF